MTTPNPSLRLVLTRLGVMTMVATLIVTSAFCGAVRTSMPAASPLAAGADDPGALAAVRYSPPTDAAIVDPFRPPETPYGPGNRGLEYGTTDGQIVHASADGRVRFAGQVGTHSSVTLIHDDGVITTYSMLTEILVVAGEDVAADTAIGVVAAGFHFGAKRGQVYLDPAILLQASASGAEHRAVLVPMVGSEDP